MVPIAIALRFRCLELGKGICARCVQGAFLFSPAQRVTHASRGAVQRLQPTS